MRPLNHFCTEMSTFGFFSPQFCSSNTNVCLIIKQLSKVERPWDYASLECVNPVFTVENVWVFMNKNAPTGLSGQATTSG